MESQGEFTFEEHESGPELLVYVAVVTAGISLVKSVIDLIVSILKARSEGVKRGSPGAPLELIVRRTQKNGEVKEETILRIGHHETINREMVEKHLKKSIAALIKEGNKETANKSIKRDAAKSRRAP